tara:strand:- start:39 stop:152 length:114 start_codon:yes stop_codon:yes gene_type:complete
MSIINPIGIVLDSAFSLSLGLQELIKELAVVYIIKLV